ncbi:MAG: hypothetical protein GXX91_13705, partial [Verrucomicrobiaceae bacterium]|nr:hypothetical protein [Verrucomicrobiaceae bacterium]
MKSEPSSAPETLDLLGRFASGLRSFAEREKGLERARQLRDSSLRQTMAERRAGIEREHAAVVERLHEETEDSGETLATVARTRRERIDRARIRVRQAVIAEIQAREGHYRAALQRDFMDAGRERERRLAEAEATYAEHESVSHKIQGRYGKLEKAVAARLRGFARLQRRFLVELKEVEAPVRAEVAASDLEARYELLSRATRRLGRSPLVIWFSGFPLVLQLFLLLGAAAVAPLVLPRVSWVASLTAGVALAVGVVMLWTVARKTARRFLENHLATLVEAKEMRLRHREEGEIRYRVALDEIELDHARVKEEFEKGLKQGPGGTDEPSRYATPEEVEERAERLKRTLADRKEARLGGLRKQLAEQIAALERARDETLAAVESGEK